MKARKLKSGRWNARAYIGKDKNGKAVYRSYTADTKAEAERLAAVNSFRYPTDMRVGDMVDAFIEARKEVLSPSTYRGYLSAYKANIEGIAFASIPVSSLDTVKAQRWVNDLTEKHSPKTVKNIYGMFAAALRYFYPDIRLTVKLPQGRQPKLHTPTTEEVKAVTALAKERDPELYKAILLGGVGMMRRGEIAALTAEDLDFKRNTVSITKSVARTSDNKWVIKPPKTEASNRTIVMPKFVMNALPKSGKTVQLTPAKITEHFHSIVKAAGVHQFRFHDLRHYAASIAASSSVGASAETIKARGGWSTDSVMKRVYINQIGDEIDKDTKNVISFYERMVDC